MRARFDSIHEEAWAGARKQIEHIQDNQRARGEEVEFTPDLLEGLRCHVLGLPYSASLTNDQMELIGDFDWELHAPPEKIRRRINLEKRMRDYPEPHRMLPTRLGNVLRHHEDETGWPQVETAIQELFDGLPLSTQVEHDEQRTRLDLYCSMVLVSILLALTGVIRLISAGPTFALSVALTGAASAGLMYRAAVTSARAYGGLLVLISEQQVHETEKEVGEELSALTHAAQRVLVAVGWSGDSGGGVRAALRRALPDDWWPHR